MTMKLIRFCLPWVSTLTMPIIRAGPMNMAEAKAIRAWLKYSCAGRVRTVEWLSIQAPTAISARAMAIGLFSFSMFRVKALTRVPAIIDSRMTTKRP